MHGGVTSFGRGLLDYPSSVRQRCACRRGEAFSLAKPAPGDSLAKPAPGDTVEDIVSPEVVLPLPCGVRTSPVWRVFSALDVKTGGGLEM